MGIDTNLQGGDTTTLLRPNEPTHVVADYQFQQVIGFRDRVIISASSFLKREERTLKQRPIQHERLVNDRLDSAHVILVVSDPDEEMMARKWVRDVHGLAGPITIQRPKSYEERA